MDVINPHSIDVTLDQIGGCDRIKRDLVREAPLQTPWSLPPVSAQPARVPPPPHVRLAERGRPCVQACATHRHQQLPSAERLVHRHCVGDTRA